MPWHRSRRPRRQASSLAVLLSSLYLLGGPISGASGRRLNREAQPHSRLSDYIRDHKTMDKVRGGYPPTTREGSANEPEKAVVRSQARNARKQQRAAGLPVKLGSADSLPYLGQSKTPATSEDQVIRNMVSDASAPGQSIGATECLAAQVYEDLKSLTGNHAGFVDRPEQMELARCVASLLQKSFRVASAMIHFAAIDDVTVQEKSMRKTHMHLQRATWTPPCDGEGLPKAGGVVSPDPEDAGVVHAAARLRKCLPKLLHTFKEVNPLVLLESALALPGPERSSKLANFAAEISETTPGVAQMLLRNATVVGPEEPRLWLLRRVCAPNAARARFCFAILNGARPTKWTDDLLLLRHSAAESLMKWYESLAPPWEKPTRGRNKLRSAVELAVVTHCLDPFFQASGFIQGCNRWLQRLPFGTNMSFPANIFDDGLLAL